MNVFRDPKTIKKVPPTLARVEPAKPKFSLRPLPFDFDNLKYCDVRLKADGETFEAHKFILATQSPFFDKMFSGDFKEQGDGEVNLDMDSAILFTVLKYMYTGKVKKLDEISYELIQTADFLQMDGLKKVCELSLENQLTLLNCVELTMLANKINASSLKKRAIEYIVNNKSQVERCLLKKLFQADGELGMELFLFQV